MKKIYVLFTMLLALGFGNLMAQGQGLCTYSQDSVKQTVLELPQQDGKCIYLLVLEDSGNDGWDGASIDVSIAEGDATNYKVTPQDGECLTIPIYIEEGQSIDLTYWNGANETEHSFYLYDSNGDLAIDNEGTTMAVGPNIPANEQFRVKATCPFSNCNGELLETDMFVQGLLCPDEPVFWQIVDSNGDIVYAAGPTIDIAELQQDSIFLEKCEEYTLVFGSSIGTDWASLSWRLRTLDPNYGDLLFQGIRVIAGDNPAPADFVDGMLMQNITIPCEPKADDLIVIEGGDPATCTYVGIDIDGDTVLDSDVNFPLVEPISSYPQLGDVLCESPAVTVDDV